MKTVRVKLLCGRVGNDFNQAAGSVVELEAGEARRMVESQQAEYIDEPVEAPEPESVAEVTAEKDEAQQPEPAPVGKWKAPAIPHK